MQSMLLGLSGRFAEGLAAAHRAVEADPSNFFAHWNLARSYLWAGEYEKAIAMGPALLASSGRQVWLIVVLTWAHAGFGNASISRALYDELDARSRSEYVSRAWQSAAAIAVGRLDEAMGLARRAVEDRDAFVLLTRHFWFFEPLWNRPDFQELLDRIGFVGPARK